MVEPGPTPASILPGATANAAGAATPRTAASADGLPAGERFDQALAEALAAGARPGTVAEPAAAERQGPAAQGSALPPAGDGEAAPSPPTAGAPAADPVPIAAAVPGPTLAERPARARAPEPRGEGEPIPAGRDVQAAPPGPTAPGTPIAAPVTGTPAAPPRIEARAGARPDRSPAGAGSIDRHRAPPPAPAATPPPEPGLREPPSAAAAGAGPEPAHPIATSASGAASAAPASTAFRAALAAESGERPARAPAAAEAGPALHVGDSAAALSRPEAAPGRSPTFEMTTPVRSPGWTEELGARVSWLVEKNVSSASLKLNPAELGPIEIRIRVHGGDTTVGITVQHGAAHDSVEASLPRLREMLAESGLVRVDVGLSQSPRDDGARPGQAQPSAEGGETPPDDDPETPAPNRHASRAVGLLDRYA